MIVVIMIDLITKHAGLTYYTLGNLHPKYCSSLKSIHLLNAVYYHHIIKYGIDAILQPIVDAVKKLEQASFHAC